MKLFGGGRKSPWATSRQRSWRRPVNAICWCYIAIAGLVLLIALAQPFDLVRYRFPAMAGIMVAAVALWVLIWRRMLRGRSIWWWLGGAATLLGLSAFVMDTAYSWSRAALIRDIAVARELQVSPNGTPLLPVGAVPGPLTQREIAFYRAEAIATRADNAAVVRFRFSNFTPQDILANPMLVQDCDRFARAKPLYADMARRRIARRTAYRADVMALIDDPAIRAWFDQQFAPSLDRTRIARWQQLIDRELDLTVQLCTLMARRNWALAGDSWKFTNASDYAAYTRFRQAYDAGRREMATFYPSAPGASDMPLKWQYM